jgi:hypothetical protein
MGAPGPGLVGIRYIGVKPPSVTSMAQSMRCVFVPWRKLLVCTNATVPDLEFLVAKQVHLAPGDPIDRIEVLARKAFNATGVEIV